MNTPIDGNQLEAILKESLEKDITTLLAERLGLSVREAMDVYYRSKLSRQIDNGTYGIQYLDAVYLVEDLLENEPDLID